jgi:activator of HSP90 ATPase
MKIESDCVGLASVVSRRRVIAGIVMALGGLAIDSRATGGTPETMVETPTSKETQMRTSIHQDVAFKASPQLIYEALLDSKQFAGFTGSPAEIDPREGGAFSRFGGRVSGRNIELVPDQRIVQAWRPASWAKGIYSIVRFELAPQGSGTAIAFDHTGFPEGKYDGLLSGWNEHYWGPLAKYPAS